MQKGLGDTRSSTLLLVLMLASAAGLHPLQVEAAPESPASAQSLWQWQERYVRLAPQATAGASPNDHPVRFTPVQIGAMLSSLRVDKPGQKRVFVKDEAAELGVPIFSGQELEVLSDTLSRGLAQAGPRQDVVFLTVGNYDYAFGGVLKERQVNTGRVFYRDGELNIIFGAVHGELKGPRGAGALVAYPAEIPEPGMRRAPAASKRDWKLRLEDGISLHSGDGRTRGDWVLIEPAVVIARYEEQQQRLEEPQPGVPSGVRQEMSRITQEQDRLRREVEQLQQQVDTPDRPAAAAVTASEEPPEAAVEASVTTPSPTSQSVLEQRLRRLKDLRDKGLVSEEIYNAKVKELLDEGL
jgi:hypothetical protein